jgi:hypothetical protein
MQVAVRDNTAAAEAARKGAAAAALALQKGDLGIASDAAKARELEGQLAELRRKVEARTCSLALQCLWHLYV